MSQLTAEAFADWIGRCWVREEIISDRLIDQFKATLGGCLADAPVPHGLFWALMPEARPANELGRDGHPRTGLLLPALPFPRRMWAGGELDLRRSFAPGEVVRRTSTIENIAFKSGSTGPLGFVTLRHHYDVAGERVIEERQDIVYRQDPTPGQARPVHRVAADLGPALMEMRLVPDPVLLFRYSALTFNGHRIHYDRPYAISVEGYDDLVVHGPLQATLMLNLVVRLIGRLPARFASRGVAPLACGQPIRIEAFDSGEDVLSARVRIEGGPVTMTATAWP